MKLKLKLLARNTFGYGWPRPGNREIVGLRISKEKNMFVVAERFLSDIVLNMVNIQFQQMMEVPGIHKHVGS